MTDTGTGRHRRPDPPPIPVQGDVQALTAAGVHRRMARPRPWQPAETIPLEPALSRAMADAMAGWAQETTLRTAGTPTENGPPA